MNSKSAIPTCVKPSMGRRNPKYLLLLVLPFIIVLSSCANKSKVPEDTLVKVYAEIVIAQDSVAVSSKEFSEVKQKIFKKYGVTSKDYSASIELMNKDPKQWDSFFEKVIAYVESLKPKINQPPAKKAG